MPRILNTSGSGSGGAPATHVASHRGGGSDALTAADIPIVDSGGFTPATNVETALAQALEESAIAMAGVNVGIPNDFASTGNGLGAGLVGIHDSANYFASTTVEGALAEIGAYMAAHP